MIFEKKFPSLKIKEQILIAGEPNEEPRYTMWTMERLLEDIQEHCIDKAKVREVIEQVASHGEGDYLWLKIMNKFARDKIFKELEL